MDTKPTDSNWADARGEKWLARLGGTEAMLEPVNEPLIRELCLDAPYRIADIGCGGGGASMEILRRAAPGSRVHGYDISPVLIEAARARIGPGEHALAFDIADMTTAPAPAVPYDRLVSRFGIMFFGDAPSAFANLFRWLAPGGRFALAAWGPLAENPWTGCIREVVGTFIDLPPVDLEGPGPFRYGAPEKLLTILNGAGFAELNVASWRGMLPLGGGLPPAEAAQFALAAISSYGDLLAEAGEEAVRNACESLTARFAEHQQDGIVRMGACVHIFTGYRIL